MGSLDRPGQGGYPFEMTISELSPVPYAQNPLDSEIPNIPAMSGNHAASALKARIEKEERGGGVEGVT